MTTPTRRVCHNQPKGCTHSDTGIKCIKHELFFCQHRSDCFICGLGVSRSSLSAHYDSADHDTYKAGSTWRAAETVRWRCLLASVAGTAVCEYELDDSYFVLRLYLPVSSERVGEFRCEVTVSDPVSGHARSFTPGALEEKVYDWIVEVNKEEFQSWYTEFDINVNVIKL